GVRGVASTSVIGTRRTNPLLLERYLVDADRDRPRVFGRGTIARLSMRVTLSTRHALPATIVLALGMIVPPIDSEFVFETAPFASAHASTIVDTRDGLVAAWFGGTREGAADVGIWLSRHERGGWTAPVETATAGQRA